MVFSNKSRVSLIGKPYIDTGLNQKEKLEKYNYWAMYTMNSEYVGTFSTDDMLEYARNNYGKYICYPRKSLRRYVNNEKYKVDKISSDGVKVVRLCISLSSARSYAKRYSMVFHVKTCVTSIDDNYVLYRYEDGNLTFSYVKGSKGRYKIK